MKYLVYYLLLLAGIVLIGTGGAFFLQKPSPTVVFDASANVSNFDNDIIVGAKDLSIPSIGKAINVNQDEMLLSLFQDGNKLREFKIIRIPRNDSVWETVPGRYKVRTKEEKHFSTIGNAWMPYSIQFFTNNFIHGEPQYSNGRKIRNITAGGIRLSTADAEIIYSFAEKGTPIIVAGGRVSDGITATKYRRVNVNVSLPKIKAKSYLVADLDTGEVILERDSETVRPIASITKLTTALVSLETINQDELLTISRSAVNTFGYAGRLISGDSLSAKDLLYPLLLESSNDAAEVLAEKVGREKFISLMNEKAHQLKLTNTNYADPSGLTQKNVSNTRDLLKLAKYIYDEQNVLLDLTALRRGTSGKHVWNNSSKFIKDKSYLGGKNGYTDEARHTLVALFELPLSEFRHRNIAIILLGTDNKESDVRNIIDYLGRNVYYSGADLAQVNFARGTQAAVVPIPISHEVSLAFVGDLMLDRGVKRSVQEYGEGDYDYLFQYAAALKNADILFGNLEGPVSDKGKNVGSIYSFRMDPAILPILREAGFKVLSVANNHAGDWSIDAFEDSVRRIKEAEIIPVGGDKNKTDASKPKIVEVNGLKVGWLGFSDVGPDWLAAGPARSGILLAGDTDYDKIIKEASSQVDVLVVSIHFGEEYKPAPNNRQVALARRAIDAGAKIVAGHHPHVAQPVERYKGGVIAYSLGNFIFDQNFSKETMEGLLLSVTIRDKQIKDVKEIKTKLTDHYQPNVPEF